MKKTKKILLAFFAAAAVSAGAAALAGCSSDSAEGQFTINSVSGLAPSYAVGAVISTDSIRFECTDASGNKVTKTFKDVEIEGAGDYAFGVTSEEGVYSFTVMCNGATYSVGYYVSSLTLTLDFNGGTYNGKSSYTLLCDASGADTSLISAEDIVAGEDGYAFAGWFYDAEGTERVELTDGILDLDRNTTVYACYDVDWSAWYSYEISNGSVTLTAVNARTFFKNSEEDTKQQFIIPATIELYPVTAIGDEFAYTGNSEWAETYTELVFEEGSKVETIGARAFAGLCFETIAFPESLKKIGAEAFMNNTELTGTLTLTKNLISIGKQAFMSTNITTLDAEAGCALTEIGEEAFIYCSLLASIDFPDKLTTIGASVFEYCSEITTLHIPASVTNIAVGALSAMSNLTEITVDSGNTDYTVANGDLYRINGDNLSLYRFSYGYNGGRSSYVPPVCDRTVTNISTGAFSLDYDTTSIALKNIYLSGVTSIGEGAFANCTAQVWISDTVTTIAAGAFEEYKGTEIKLGNNFASVTKTATDYYSVDDDGVLYNADKTELVCILRTYDKDTYTLPETVKIIRSGAIVRNDNIYLVIIPEDSALERIQANGIQIGSMNRLCGIYCYKDTPFTLADSAFDSDNNFKSPYVYVKESAYSAYASAWANYTGYLSNYIFSGQSDKTRIGVSDILSTAEKHAARLVDIIEEAGYTPYEAVQKGVTGRPLYEYSVYDTDYYEAFKLTLDVCIMLDVSSDYADYLYGYAADFIKLIKDYYSTDYFNEHIALWDEYTDSEKNTALGLDDYIAQALAYKNGTSVTTDPEIEKLNEYFGKYTYDAATFDVDAFKEYYDKMHTAEVVELRMYYALDADIAVNYMKGETSYLISQLKALGDLTTENYIRACSLVYGDGGSSAGIASLIYSLYWNYGAIDYDWDVYDFACDDNMIAGYSDYLTVKGELYGDVYEEYIAEQVKYIENFEITSTYDEEKYQEFIDLYDSMVWFDMRDDWVDALAAKGLSAKYNAILSSYWIHNFFEEYVCENSTKTDSEIDAESEAIYKIIHTNGLEYVELDNPDFGTDDIKEYHGWIVDLEKFDAKYAELEEKYDAALAALKEKLDSYVTDGAFAYDKLTAEAYEEIIALEEAAQPHIDDLIKTKVEVTTSWGYTYVEYRNNAYYTYLNGIELWNKLEELKTAYPDASAITDYDGLYTYLYSYYDVAKAEAVEGLDYYYDTLGLTYGKETFEKYAAVFATDDTNNATDGDTDGNA